MVKDEDGIVVATKVVADSKFKAVQATMTVPARLEELVGLVRDVSACDQWAHLCKSSREIRVVSETELFVYSYNDLPWPVSDRDAVAHVNWSLDPVTGVVLMTANVVTDEVPEVGKVPPVKGAVRLSYAMTSWRFLALPDGTTRVTTDAHVDPGGPLPAWVTNMLLVDAPFQTMTKMRDVVARGDYADAKFGFLGD